MEYSKKRAARKVLWVNHEVPKYSNGVLSDGIECTCSRRPLLPVGDVNY